MRVTYIELLGQQYPMCLSLTAVEELSERFGDLDKMSKALTSGDIVKIARAANDVVEILIRAGRVYCTAMGQQVPPELPCCPADAIDITDGAAIRAIMATIRSDTKREVETKSKNAEATQGD